MGAFEARLPVPVRLGRRDKQPLIVIGITHSQTCLVLRGRLRALREAGFRVVLLCSPGELLDRLAAEEGIEAIPIPMLRSFSPVRDLISLVRISRTLLRLKPAMTEFSTPKAGLLGSLAAVLCGVPKRVYLLRGLRLETASGWRRAVLSLSEWIAGACNHVILCNSRSLRDAVVQLGLARADKVRVLGSGSSNGVDTQHFAPTPGPMRTRSCIRADAPVIGFVGRLTRDKGVPDLVAAFEQVLRKVPAARLLLVGWYDESDDALSEEFRARIDGHAQIIRTGFVEDTAPWYRQMDLMVLPTWREGFPNAVLEAAASGVPVVTTRATGARDAVLAGVTGVLVPVGDPGALADAMLRLLAAPERRRAMGRAGRQWICECFPRERVLGRTVAFYQSLVCEPARSSSPAFATDGFGAD